MSRLIFSAVGALMLGTGPATPAGAQAPTRGAVMAQVPALARAERASVEAQAALAGVESRLALVENLAQVSARLAEVRPALAMAHVQLARSEAALAAAPMVWRGLGQFQTTAPEPWLQADPADSLYRLARAALNRARYRQALELFEQLQKKYPRSGYAPDALYWEAFARYRLGGPSNLRQALARLDDQARRYPKAATRGDADALSLRIKAELARYGDASAQQDVEREAQLAVVAPPSPPRQPGMPVTAPRAPRAPAVAGMQDNCSEDEDTKVMALQAIMRNDPDRGRELLKKLMARRDPESLCLRRHALFIAATGNPEAASDLLIDAATSDPDKEVRQSAIFWLARTDDPRAVAVLDSVLQASTDEDVQQAALFALGTKHDAHSRDVLRAYVTKNGITDELRGAALFQVARDPATTPALLQQLYAQAKTTDFKQQILAAMLARPDRDTKWLMSIASNPNEDEDIRQQAVMLLTRSDASTADLLKLFDALPDGDARNGMLVMLIAQRPRDPALTDRLISLARNAKDRETRQMAIFWLSQSKDPRATKALEEILDQ